MTENTLAGRPIKGEISRYSERTSVEQWDESKFLELLDQALDCKDVEAVKWRQYTPYFNDGEACYFSVYGVSVKPVDGDDEAGDYEDGFLDSWETRPESRYDHNKREYIFLEEPSELYKAFSPFSSAVEGGHFDNLLNQAFGDPAEVTATRDGFEVEFYDHD